jgi:hypothetical protein
MNTENNPDDLLGAITGALDNLPEGGDPDLGEENPPEDETPPEGEDETPPEGEEADEEAEEEAGEEGADEEAEGEEPPPGELGPDGKPLKPAKDFDPMKDPLPKGTLQRTVDSFNRLRDVVTTERTRAEKAETQLTEVTERHNELVDTITGAGLDGKNFNTMLGYASHFNSPVFEDRQKAYKFLVSELTALAKDLGETPPGVHPLTGHDDLVAEVRANPPTLTLQRAVEIAQQRNREQAKTAHEAKHGAQLRERQEGQAARGAAQEELRKLGVQLAAKDGKEEFNRKSRIVLKEMHEDIKALPPARWAKAFERAYRLVPSAAPAAKPKSKNQPLRGKSPAGGGGVKQPKNLKEAIFGAFEKQ